MNCGGEDTSVRAEKGKVFTVCASINAAGHLRGHRARKDEARLSSPPGCGGGYECVCLSFPRLCRSVVAGTCSADSETANSLSLPNASQRLEAASLTYECGDAASADGGLEVALQLLLDGAGGVEALSQEDDGVDEEEGGHAVDDVLEDLDPAHRQTSPHL